MNKNNSQYLGLGGCALAIIGCFLPFASTSILGLTVNYIDGDGKILLIAMIISAVLIFLKKEKISLIPTCIGGVLFLIDAFKALTSSYINIGIGIIVILIGLICAIVFPFLKK